MTLHLSHLGWAYWFSGRFDRGYKLIEEALNIQGKLGANNANTIGWLIEVNAYAGRYSVARRLVETSLKPDDLRAREMVGWIALAEGNYREAEAQLQEALASQDATRDWWTYEYRTQLRILLGRALYGLGRHIEAQQHLCEAVQMTVKIKAFIPLLHLLAIIPVVLIDLEANHLKERAVELYALAESNPYIANSQFCEDIAGQYVHAAAATLPPNSVKAAQARGQKLDWWQTGVKLSQELTALDWASSSG